jgi:hypothetical protein
MNKHPGADIFENELLVAFARRCESRAAAVRAKLATLPDAVDAMQDVAQRDGLVHRYGQDEIQRVMAQAFGGGA